MFSMIDIEKEENKYYTYIYLDPRKPGEYIYDDLNFEYEPFYVGKGTKSRCNVGLYDGKNKKTHKSNKITKMIKEGYFPIVLKILENVSNYNACLYEIEVIEKIGRLELNSGPLVNLTGGGEVGAQAGAKHTKEWIEILSIPVIQYDLEMNFIKEFSSIKEAANELNVAAIQISRVCNKLARYKTAKGFIWEFKKENKQRHFKTDNQIIRAPHSEETKKKMSKPKKWKTEDGKHPLNGKILKSKYPPIIQYDLEMNFVKEWETVQLLCKTLNYTMGNMMQTLRNSKNYAIGYYWKFKEIN